MVRVVHLLPTFAVAFAAVAMAAVVRAICHSVFGETIPYTPFYPAIVLATMYGRRAGGLAATIMAAFAASFWLTPFGRPQIQEATDLIGLVLFLLVSGIVVVLCESMRLAWQKAEVAAHHQQQATTREHTARLEAEEANRAKDHFLASVSHELRTPLQAILGWAHLLRDEKLDAATRCEGLEVIERNAKTQSRLIEDLIDMTRMAAGKMRIVPQLIHPRQPIEAAIQTVALAANGREIMIERQFDDEDCNVWGDPDRIQQITWNLLSNSIKFSPSGSCIRISLRRIANEVHLAITDEGIGIEPEFLPYIFEPFRQADGTHQRRHGGLGLGLSIVQHLVELHGGRITATSAGSEQGLSIAVIFPIAKDTPNSDDYTGLSKRELRGLRVLVVDDDPTILNVIHRVLEDREVEVLAVDGVDGALAAIDDFQPDVLISDIAMPDRDGYELLRQIRRRQKPNSALVPAIAISAFSGLDDRRRTLQAGYSLHLAKPVDATTLTNAVAEVALTISGKYGSSQ